MRATKNSKRGTYTLLRQLLQNWSYSNNRCLKLVDSKVSYNKVQEMEMDQEGLLQQKSQQLEMLVNQTQIQVQTIERNDWMIVRSFANPPDIVFKVISVVCILLEGRPAHNWNECKRLWLGQHNFMQLLLRMDQKFPTAKWERVRNEMVRRELNTPEFQQRARRCSNFAYIVLRWLKSWCKAIDLLKEVQELARTIRRKQEQMQRLQQLHDMNQ